MSEQQKSDVFKLRKHLRFTDQAFIIFRASHKRGNFQDLLLRMLRDW